jgi:hypothetical protein
VPPDKEIINNNIGNDLGIFSNLKIRKRTANSIKIEMATLLNMDIISCIEAYLHIPWYKPIYFKREIFDNENRMEKSHNSSYNDNAL